jgi:hypothetical protein
MIDLRLEFSPFAPVLVLLLTGCHDDPSTPPAGPGSTTGTSPTDVVGTSTGDASSSTSSSSSGAVDSTTGSSSGSTGDTGESSGTTGPGIVDPGCPECLVLAEGLQGGRGLSVHAEWVYFTDQDAGTVHRVPKGGGEIELVANFQDQPYDVVANDEHAFWTTFVEGGSVWRAELPDAFPVALSADDFPRMMQLVGDHVYWCTFDDLLGRVRRVPSSGIGNAPETLVEVGSGVADLVVYGSQVYFTVHETPLEPGLAPPGVVYMAAADVPTDPVDLGIVALDQSEPWGIAAAADTIFWANGLGSPDDQPQSVVTAPSTGGGALDVVAPDQLSPFAVAADDQYVYWTDYTEVRAVSHMGGEPIDLAVMQNVARAIAVDETDVFWITRSRVLERPKP